MGGRSFRGSLRAGVVPSGGRSVRVFLRPGLAHSGARYVQQREAPPNRRGPTPPRPTTLQLCPYMVAARLMTLLWSGPDTPT